MDNRFDKLSGLIVMGSVWDELDDPAYATEKIVREKGKNYEILAKRYNWLYYMVRLVAGISAGLLPFFLHDQSHAVPTILSVAIVVATLIDLVFQPKEKKLLYSEASDLLTAVLASTTDPDRTKRWRQAFEVVLKTEAALRNLSSALSETVTTMANVKH